MDNLKNKNRDLESEREELVRTINNLIPKELKEDIDFVVSCLPPDQQQILIKFSNSGSSNADTQ